MKPLIVLDGDGVLVDFHLAYASAWQRAFGEHPAERDAQAYWPHDRWQVERISGERMEQFRTQFNEQMWATMPAIDGAVAACHRLADAGYDLVCVTALEERLAAARQRNLRNLGFPIERVIATGNTVTERSPKADVIEQLKPVAFVDDYLPFLRGIPPAVHCALVLRAPNGSPNTGPDLALAHSLHQDLSEFTAAWLS